METKKCMWCLKEIDSDSKYCSTECEDKTKKSGVDGREKSAKKGIGQVIVDIIGSWF